MHPARAWVYSFGTPPTETEVDKMGGTTYCTCETPVMDVAHDAGCRRCGLPVDFSPKAPTPGVYDSCPIEELELGVGAYNVLKRMGVNTLAELVRVTPDELDRFKRENPSAVYNERRVKADVVEAQAWAGALLRGAAVA